MKNFTLIAILGLFAGLTLNSCAGKKDYTCTCVVGILNTDTTFLIEIDDVKKKEAEQQCKGAEAGFNTVIGFPIANCDID